MAYSITQARTLLNAAELELFDHSRADPIKALTLARLRGKVTRARTLRDKYRDLYRRQTVAVRSASSTKGRSPVGADNERTQRKADILQEVLGRFEARLTQMEAREERDGQGSSAAASKRTAPKAAAEKAAQKAAPKAASRPSAKQAMKTSASKTAGNTATKTPTSTTAEARATASNPTKSTTSKAGAANKQIDPADTSDADKRDEERTARAEPLQEAVLNQHATRSSKAPSDKAPTANGKAHAPPVHAPIDMAPAALRGNLLKQAPGQIAIHAHQASSMRRAQGKRDSR